MDILFDRAKDQANRAKHGISLAAAAGLDWDTALIWVDRRLDYGERRECALGMIGDRLYYAVFVQRAGRLRMISLRRANIREVRRYDNET